MIRVLTVVLVLLISSCAPAETDSRPQTKIGIDKSEALDAADAAEALAAEIEEKIRTSVAEPDDIDFILNACKRTPMDASISQNRKEEICGCASEFVTVHMTLDQKQAIDSAQVKMSNEYVSPSHFQQSGLIDLMHSSQKFCHGFVAP